MKSSSIMTIMASKDEDYSSYIKIQIDPPKWADKYPIENIYEPHQIVPISETGQMADFTTMQECNKAIESCRIALFQFNDALKKIERSATSAQATYNRHWNRAYLEAEGKTDSIRRAIADIKTEKYENDLLAKQQVAKEMGRKLRLMNNELEALKLISYNLRKEIDAQS